MQKKTYNYWKHGFYLRRNVSRYSISQEKQISSVAILLVSSMMNHWERMMGGKNDGVVVGQQHPNYATGSGFNTFA